MGAASHKGCLCLVLHAHLPYIRHPEHEFFLEENWLYEAITETYIPLLDVFSRLIDDGVDFRVTLSLSPVLLEMLNDGLLRERYERHIERLIGLSEREVFRTRRDTDLKPVTKMYHESFLKIRRLFTDVCKRDLVRAFRMLQETGKIGIIPTAATHAFLPHLSLYPQAVNAQLRTGIEHYRTNFGRSPKGIWLPECGFAPGFDGFIKEKGVEFFFLETHGIMQARPAPRYGVYAPLTCPSGVAAFGRDEETSGQVWSSIHGYPGDYYYRDFYRDIGFDLDLDYVKAHIKPYGAETYTGLKYYRITGKTGRKEPYNIQKAEERAAEHARHFINSREMQINRLSDTLKIEPVVTAVYDAELFGHWWFEGTQWLDKLLRGIYLSKVNFRTVNPSEYLRGLTFRKEGLQSGDPAMSSWGENGYGEVWLNRENDYIYRHLLVATERMIGLADRFPVADGVLQRALNQAAREVLLSQHSDWAFIMKGKTASQYAKKRFEEHIGRFTFLYRSVLSDNVSETVLADMEDRDRIFREIDYRVFSRRQPASEGRQL